MKRKILNPIFVLFLSVIVFSSIFLTAYTPEPQKTNLDTEYALLGKTYCDEEFYNELIETQNFVVEIEDSLIQNNSSIEDQLTKQIEYYQDVIENATDEETIDKAIILINSTREILSTYENNDMASVYSGFASDKPIDNSDLIVFYSAATAAIIAHFNNNKLVLAAELLTYAKSNNQLDSYYTPVNVSIVLNSTTYKQVLNSTYTSSEESISAGERDEWAFTEGVDGEDLFNAIHGFSFVKAKSGRVVSISDRYDFKGKESYDSIAGAAVNCMNNAQAYGVITPYYITIKTDYNGVAINPVKNIEITDNTHSDAHKNWGYCDEIVALGQGEYYDFRIYFKYGGEYNIQTFGINDTYLSLYNENDLELASNDDSGYNRNALINYTIQEDATYIVRLKFYNSSTSGVIKLVINRTSDNITSNDDIIYTNSRDFKFYNNVAMGGSCFQFIYKPLENRKYLIETQGSFNSFIYLLDPRSTLSSQEYTAYSEDNSACLHNNNGSGGRNAKIERRLAKDIPYIIIYSTNTKTAASGSIALKINELIL